MNSRTYLGRDPDPGEPTWRLPCGHDVAWIGFNIFEAIRGRVECATCFRERVVAAARQSGAPAS